MNDKRYQVALSLLPKVGGATCRQLLSYIGSAEKIFNSSFSDLIHVPQIGEKTARNILAHLDTALSEAETELAICQQHNIQPLFLSDTAFPTRLRNHHDCPIILYYKGNANLNASKVVSVVGTRNSTEYGKRITSLMISELQKLDDILIISGLAYGIDICAHRACLEHQIPTVGIMANGLKMVYPNAHYQTAQTITQNGGLLTENPFHSKPDGAKFPARNRIIAGMSDAVIVVEAKAKGGALITAEFANDYGVEVFTFPGRITDTASEGCLNLIKQHKANLITDTEDLIQHMNWDKGNSQPIQKKIFIDLSPQEQMIMQLLHNSPMLIDDLCLQSKIPMGKLSGILLQLEFHGIVKPLPGKKYILT
ncbi:DNA-processing protein DprA [Limibacter armeniacum]|uniref:DNA-processing protein DprA n=1 Tax=Limibacter armeniacum TaxID=466084 RepID=UPI002FE5FDB9